MSTKSVILLGMLILLQVPAAATEYYVDIQNGSNQTGDGNIGNPWRNITYALAQISGTGHTIHVAPGVYDKSQDAGGLSESFPIQMETGVSIVGDQGAAVTVLDALNQSPRTRVIQAVSIAAGTVLQGLTIKNGQASDSGGGIYMSSSSMTVQDCIIESNAASSSFSSTYGGGIYISGGFSNTPLIDGCIIRNNSTVTSSSNGIAFGGGVFVSGAVPTITDNSIIGNSASQAVYSNPTYGGGIHLSSCPGSSITRNIIVSNSLSSTDYAYGGGLYLISSSGSISRNLIKANTLGSQGTRAGGGIYISGSYSGAPSIIRNEILGNDLQGLYIGSSQVMNNTVARNGTNGVYVIGSASIINNSIVNNGSHGLYGSSSGNTTVRNNVIASNSGYAMYEAAIGFDFTADYNLLYSNPSGLCFDEGTTPIGTLAQLNITSGYTNNLEGNPIFADEASDNYRLTSTSPAKDAGSSTSAPTDDADGEPRPNGAGYDIGADEYYAPHAADTNTNYVIENFEMLRWVDDWANSLITQGQLDELKAIWSCLNGYKSDGFGGFTCR
ncbi:MAG: hypothetical protein GHCLOJNM_01013 [bacterium]|nr:hypothetical protein [bacterium]